MKNKLLLLLIITLLNSCGVSKKKICLAGNPIFSGWYADSEGIIFGDEYWVYPTFSAPYEKRLDLPIIKHSDIINGVS